MLREVDSWIAELEGAGVKVEKVELKSHESASCFLDTWIKSIECDVGVGVDDCNREKKDKRPQEVKNSADDIHAGLLEFRVGKILEAWEHPESEKLYCEKIDIGEAEPRLIASGLGAYYSFEV
jgi:tRNA-binding EMAP/Myf-like protein